MDESKTKKYLAPSIVILPLGTGNALANSLGAKDDYTWGLSTLVQGTPAWLPLFRATFSSGARLLVNEGRDEEEIPTNALYGGPTLHGAVVVSWGMHATLVADSDTAAYRKFGVDRFKMAAKEALYPADGSAPHPYKAKVSIVKRNGADWVPLPRQEHMYVLATMVSNLERTFTISPASKPVDGHLRLVHFGPQSADEAMRIMGLAYQGGKHVQDPAVGYEDIDGIKIEFEEEDARWRRVCIDGKIVRVEKGGRVEVRREETHVLKVVCRPENGAGD
jgi:diacylglycerol kinase family enzyme